METLNPNAKFILLLKKLRSKSHNTPSLEEITKEGEEVRQIRYERQTK